MNDYKVFGVCTAYAQLLMIWLWLWNLVDNVWIILSPLLFHLFIMFISALTVLVLVLGGQALRRINGR